MANHRAIASVCAAVVRLLDSAYQPSLLGNTPLRFEVYRTRDFQSPMEAGVSIYLYRVQPNTVQRTPPSRHQENGQRRRPQLPLDVHFLLTAWGKSASLEQTVLGWAMRVLEDRAVLPAALLNTVTPGVFLESEAVELVATQLGVEEMLRLWDVLPGDYQPSVPYIARMVRIESLLPAAAYESVQVRELELEQI